MAAIKPRSTIRQLSYSCGYDSIMLLSASRLHVWTAKVRGSCVLMLTGFGLISMHPPCMGLKHMSVYQNLPLLWVCTMDTNGSSFLLLSKEDNFTSSLYLEDHLHASAVFKVQYPQLYIVTSISLLGFS